MHSVLSLSLHLKSKDNELKYCETLSFQICLHTAVVIYPPVSIVHLEISIGQVLLSH